MTLRQATVQLLIKDIDTHEAQFEFPVVLTNRAINALGDR